MSACGADPAPPATGVTGVTDAGGDDAPVSRGNDASPELTDDAVIVHESFPDELFCAVARDVEVLVRNTGTSTWTAQGGYALGAVSGTDPLSTSGPRIALDGEPVPPGATRAFKLSLLGPPAESTHTARWQMRRETAGLFGAAATHKVDVPCIELAKTTVKNSPPTSRRGR